MTIEIFDNRDKELLVKSVLSSIADLARLRDECNAYDCSTMSIQDTINRYQRILKEISAEE